MPRALLLLVPLTLLTVARPAQAGRASACKAPPFAVPKETQRAVDAAIDARVTGTGAGGASTGVETRTEYETTTLSQDAAARAWTEYTLCEKLVKKLISQELHDELLRALLAPPPLGKLEEAPGLSMPPPSGAPLEPVQALLDPRAMAGTWQVTTTFQWSTCPAPNDTAGINAYTWLVSVGDDEVLHVSVLGTTAYPELQGTLRGGQLVLSGEQVRKPVDGPNLLMTRGGDDSVTYRPRVFISMTSDGSTLTGARDLTALVGPVANTDTDDAGKNAYELCMMHYSLSGHK